MQNFHARLSNRLKLLQLARPEEIGPLVVLGLLSGLIAGGVMVIFRLLIVHPKMALLGLDDPEQHEQLPELPVRQPPCAAISVRASLLRALRRMDRLQVDALYVVSSHHRRLLGIVTRQQIEYSYRHPGSLGG